MVEPIETVISRAHESFEIDGRLNSVKTEIEDGRVLNTS